MSDWLRKEEEVSREAEVQQFECGGDGACHVQWAIPALNRVSDRVAPTLGVGTYDLAMRGRVTTGMVAGRCVLLVAWHAAGLLGSWNYGYWAHRVSLGRVPAHSR